jgi:O-antigen ligase
MKSPLAALAFSPVVFELLEKITLRMWRPAVSIYLVSAIFGTVLAADLLPETAWNILQFGPIALVSILQITMLIARPIPVIRKERLALASLLLFLLIAVTSFITSIDRYLTLLNLIFLLLMFTFLLTTLQVRWQNLRTLSSDFLFIFIFAVVNQTIGLFGFLTGMNWAAGDFNRLVGTLWNANFAGMFSTIALVIGLYLLTQSTSKASYALLLLSQGVLLATLIMSGSRGSILGFIVALFFMILQPQSRKTFVSLGTLAVAGFLAWQLYPISTPGVLPPAPGGTAPPDSPAAPFDRVLEGDISSGRFFLYDLVLGFWQERPTLGSGYRTSQVLLDTGDLEAHNIFLTILLELGVVGLSVFIAMCVLVLLRARYNLLLAGASGVIVINLTESALFGWGGPTALISWFILFGYFALRRFDGRKKENMSK